MLTQQVNVRRSGGRLFHVRGPAAVQNSGVGGAQLTSTSDRRRVLLAFILSRLLLLRASVHLLDTRHKLLHGRRGRWSRGADVELRVVGERVAAKSGVRDDIEQFH